MITFTKMQGIGNDYIYVNCMENQISNPSLFAKIASNRNFGIGSDGLILIEKSKICDLKMRIFNYDGTEAEMCGNGIRCVGKYAYEKGIVKKDIMTVETLSGTKTLQLSIVNGYVVEVTVNMGMPILELDQIPVDPSLLYDPFCLKIKGKNFSIFPVSMGNPHAVIFVENVDSLEVEKYGSLISNHPCFPNKTNVEFVEVIHQDMIKARVYERGSGETLACGTGACASVVASYLKKKTKNHVEVLLKGGVLKIDWNLEENSVYMTGPATIVYEGNILFEAN